LYRMNWIAGGVWVTEVVPVISLELCGYSQGCPSGGFSFFVCFGQRSRPLVLLRLTISQF
jgi:hypothetical protein